MAKFKIEIVFSDKDRGQVRNFDNLTLNSGYVSNNGKEDEFIFNRNKVEIIMDRDVKVDAETVLSRNNTSTYQQIQKAMLAFYSASTCWPLIKDINMIPYKNDKEQKPVKIKNFNQPISVISLDQLGGGPYAIDNYDYIRFLMEGNERARAIRNCLSYWIKSYEEGDGFSKFDKVWRAFDILILYQGGTGKEADGLKAMKKLITENAEIFSKITEWIVTQVTDETESDYIKISSFQWFNLFISLMKEDKVNELVRRFTEYKDYRINNLFKWIISESKPLHDYLESKGVLEKIEAHFHKYEKTEKDVEILLLLCVSYVYFLRCKLFHAEIIDNSFSLQETCQERQIKFFVDYLQRIVREILNNANLLREP